MNKRRSKWVYIIAFVLLLLSFACAVEEDSDDSNTTQDTTSPVVTSFTLDGGNEYNLDGTVYVAASASDDKSPTAFYITETATTPLASDSSWQDVSSWDQNDEVGSGVSVFTLSTGYGGKTVYVFFKDDADNISNALDTTIIYKETCPTSDSEPIALDSTNDMSGAGTKCANRLVSDGSSDHYVMKDIFDLSRITISDASPDINHDLTIKYYSDSSFDTLIRSCPAGSNSCDKAVQPDSNAILYVEVQNPNDGSGDVSYSILHDEF